LPASGETPTPPLQTGSSSGVIVTAGANGAVVFDTSGVDASLRKDFARGTSYACFKLARVFGILDSEGLGYEGRLQAKVAAEMNGVKPPFDGCQLSASIGRRWPDPLGGHAPVEIALTPTGRAYFADRAVARDVAAFVRAKHVQELRREPPAQALRDLRHAYAKPLARSSIVIEQIAHGLRFSERSSTGKTFYVEVQHVGARVKITHQNLKPYGFVF
jgi:streptogramin lyase